ncbi:carboxyl transferase domain-containing protein [Sphaerisporangium sp. B11E5]|uniref:acyl-CoA carboxylase subunit beta n=1 Tax=Sphaerisporangium sp. B11E5 TaxID=3153563 RepID=UPI00325EABF2
MEERDPRARLGALFDEGTLAPLPGDDSCGVTGARGLVAGCPVAAFATDPARMGGALGPEGCDRIVETIDFAVAERIPVVGVWHSGGARLGDGVTALHGVGRMFAAMVRASGVVPQISLVLGPAAGGAAYGPALTDIVVMSEGGRIFVTGPDVVREVTGEDVDMEVLGGPETHSRRSGVAHVVTSCDDEAMAETRRVTALLADPGTFRLDHVTDRIDLGKLLPSRPRRAYDVRPLVDGLVDGPGVELHPRWAPNMVTTLARLATRTVGVLANNPLRKGGCLDAASAEKAARFVRMCDSLGVPLVVVVDVPGYLPGVKQEWDGVVRRGAKLLHAFAEAVVPRVTLVTRKSYGGAYVAMNSRALGASAVFAWPSAEVAVMGAPAAVDILHRKKLRAVPAGRREELRRRLITQQEREAGGVAKAVEIGVVDEVIDPKDTRGRIAGALLDALPSRGRHTNIPL